MYYKEEWINGKLYWKASPNGEWVEFTKQQYAERLLKAESELKNLQLGAVSGLLAEHKCKFYVNANWTGYSRCECGKEYEG